MKDIKKEIEEMIVEDSLTEEENQKGPYIAS